MDTIRARLLKLFRIAITLQCGAWIALAPVIPALHQAFASHGHVFCPEHQRIEDAGPRRAPAARPFDAPSRDKNASATTSSTRSGLDARLACAFSNFVVQAASPATGAPLKLALVRREEREVVVSNGVDVRPVEIVLLAPKQSPPFSS